MGTVIGIDLGTTNTVVAVMVDGQPRVIEDDKGYKLLPSCVSLQDDGRYVVGQAARNLVITRPDRTAWAVKRLMGRRYDSPEVQEACRRMNYDIEPAPDGGCLIRMGNKLLSPVEVSALVLEMARSIAEKALGDEVDEAVITVPAYFNHSQRAATLEAARLAGLPCDRLLNEPTAAALAYGLHHDEEQTLVIYDLGGGTFDVSVLHTSGGVYEIRASRGDTWLGGEDFDFRLVDHLADEFQAKTGRDLREDRTALQRLKDAAERAKCELSFTDRTTVMIPQIAPGLNLETTVTRLVLESLVADLVDRTLEITCQAVADAGLQLSDIDGTVVVGGQTRMPRVREALADLFRKPPNRGVHPEEVVAIGAVVHAHTLVDESTSSPLLLDITPFDLGIDVAGGLFEVIINRNTQVPTQATQIFATTRDNQDAVRITVRQGESRQARDNEFLGEFVMSGLTPAPRMETKVEVTFRIDSNGMLHVSALEPGSGEQRKITVRNYAQVAHGAAGVDAEVEGDISDAPLPAEATAPVPAKKARSVSGGNSLLGNLFGSLFGGRPAPPVESGEGGQPARRRPTIELSSVSPPPAEEGAAEAPGVLDSKYVEPIDEAGVGTDLWRESEGADGLEDDEAVAVGTSPAVFAMPDAESEDLADEGFAMPDADSEDLADGAFAMPAEESSSEALDGPTLGSEEVLALPDDDADIADSAFMRPSPAERASPPEDEDLGDEPTDQDKQRTALFARPTRPAPDRRRKPARLKLGYKRLDVMIAEYRDNLRRGGCFVKTPNPLSVGRECIIEVRAPGLETPIRLDGVVTWSSKGQTGLAADQEPGMGIEYQLDERRRREIEALLATLVR